MLSKFQRKIDKKIPAKEIVVVIPWDFGQLWKFDSVQIQMPKFQLSEFQFTWGPTEPFYAGF